jgi:predicted dehydrogenase
VRVGIVGAGVISAQYVGNAPGFDAFEYVACADRDAAAAARLADAHGYRAMTVDDLLADPSIDAVLNLTPPAAHGEVIGAALRAGKHVYTEKPLATTAPVAGELVAEAERLGLRLGCAPDVFLAGPYQAARRLIDEGAIGVPLAVSAAMLAGGQATWHPNPDIFFAEGAGPLLDMGPYYLTAIVALLGPVRRVAAFASTRNVEREILIGPRAGTVFAAETPTHTAATMELEGSVTATLTASFEAENQYVYDFVVYGTEGRLALPDPNRFVGPVLLRTDDEWERVPIPPPAPTDGRGIGLQDLAEAVAAGEPHRASGALAHHVVDVARTILDAAAEGTVIEVGSRVERPSPRPA